MALKSVQETKMAAQEHLEQRAALHLKDNADLRNDILELHKLGDIPKFRGPTPSDFRAMGLPPNEHEQDFIPSNLWVYVDQGKIFV